ncbi:restriction endonuclease subunit S [Flavobacterium sp. SUN052]|uniref:restriction endonuclease subunit S n=1 Tax=Flavobacterium sp. SUN052 TaxID=3002441 RepID=UPI00237DF0A5|nr:restriction endonuclease subunit S [Flavobacterium sp. SUN052]MEC4005875.1 restriction endonuclease subunit S [Flavobacterium sp. SUN052]
MKLLEKHFEIALETPDGITRLRELILKLAMQGKLVEQNSNDKSVKILLEEIEKEKESLIKRKLMKKQSSLAEIKNEEISFSIPKSWKWTRLGNFISLLGDGIHGTPEYDNNGEYYFINGNNLIDGKIEFKENTKTVSYEQFLKHQRILNENTVFVSINGTIGNVAFYNNEKVILGKSACYFNLIKIDKFFMKRLINSKYFLNYAFSSATGTTIKNVSLKTMREFPVPLPPLEEQKRIVEKIDQLMLLCDKLEAERNRKNKLQLQINSAAINNLIKANDEASFNTAWSFIANQFDTLYTVKQNVTVLKDAILNLAIKGKLLSQNIDFIDSNDNEIKINSSDKYKINEKDYPFTLPKKWKWLALNDIGLTQTGTTPATKNSEYYGDFMPFIGPGDIKNQVIDYTNLSLTEQGVEKARLIPENSIMMVCIGGSIGKLAINNRDVACNQQINTITPYSDIDLKYLFTVLQSSYFQNQVLSNASGSATPIINKQKWISIPIPVPPYQIQKEISKRVDELFKLCNDLEKNIEQSSKKQTQLLNAVLAQV